MSGIVELHPMVTIGQSKGVKHKGELGGQRSGLGSWVSSGVN